MRGLLLSTIVLLLAVVSARADVFTDPNGTIIYPDGATITSDIYVASTAANGYDGYTTIDFTFAGGYGSATNLLQSGEGELGDLVFTGDDSSASIEWEDSYGLYMNFFSYDSGELGSFTEPVCATYPVSPCNGVVSLTDPGSFEMSWETSQFAYEVGGYGGVAGLTYTAAEPSTVVPLLAALGMVGLFSSRLKPKPPFPTRKLWNSGGEALT
jgi:hypothetical protein